MANDSNRADRRYSAADDDSRTDMNEEATRSDPGDEIRGISDEDEEFDEDEDMEEEEDEGAF